MTEVFDRIYEQNTWGNIESRSGDGSDAPGTQRLRTELAALLRKLEVQSLLDLPAGDFNWMKWVDLEGINYIGGDVVKPLIERNTKLFARENVAFHCIDACEGPIPKVDLILCRDMLVHLPFEKCLAALRNFLTSGSRYLLTTTFTARNPNRDILLGQWRPLNLQRPPFDFPRPIRYIVEDCSEWNGLWADKCMALWSLADLATSIERPQSKKSSS